MPAIQQNRHPSKPQLQASRPASVAPPVYQPIARMPVQRMQAPAVYRPDSTAPVQRSVAPMVSRPLPPAVTRRVAPPPVYRPNTGLPGQMKAQPVSIAPSAYKSQLSSNSISRPSMMARSSVLQRADQSGRYTTGETGEAQTAYAQAAAELGPAIAHGSGDGMSGQSAKFTNQEKELQDRKKEILAEKAHAQELQERQERQQEKNEKVAVRVERQRQKDVAVLRQMALYVKNNIANFTSSFDTGKSRYYAGLFAEFSATNNKKIKFTEEDVKYNLDAVIAQAKADCGW